MSHYWTGSENEAIRREQALDWLEDLREFGPEIVAEGCLRWRRQPGGRRPTPGDIRSLCIEEQRERRANEHLALPSQDQRQRIDEARVTASRMRRASAEDARLHREAFALSLGYRDFSQMMAIGLVRAVANPPSLTGTLPEGRETTGMKSLGEALGVTVKEMGE